MTHWYVRLEVLDSCWRHLVSSRVVYCLDVEHKMSNVDSRTVDHQVHGKRWWVILKRSVLSRLHSPHNPIVRSYPLNGIPYRWLHASKSVLPQSSEIVGRLRIHRWIVHITRFLVNKIWRGNTRLVYKPMDNGKTPVCHFSGMFFSGL